MCHSPASSKPSCQRSSLTGFPLRGSTGCASFESNSVLEASAIAKKPDRMSLRFERMILVLSSNVLASELDFAHFRAPVSDGGPKDRRFRDDAHGLPDR